MDTPWLMFAPSLWACGPRRPPSPRRLGWPQVEAPHQDPWQKWAQPLTSMAKAELDQICWTTLLKDFCNNTSVFLQEHFSISATSFCIFATRSIYTEAQRHSFDPKNVTWRTRGPNLWESDHFRYIHFSLLTRGHNWPSWHSMRKWWYSVSYAGSHGIRICIKRKKITYGKFFDFWSEKCVYN